VRALATPSQTVTPDPNDPALRRMRVSLLILFGLFGTFVTAWGGRAPSVREALGLSVGQLGTVIVAGSIGAVISVSLAGVVVPRIGSRRALWLGTFAGFVGLSTMGLALFAGSAPLFAAGVLTTGLANPFINVTSNLEGARVEKMSGKPALPQLHAAFPVGAVIGSGLAALSARLDIHAGWFLLFIALAVTVTRVFMIPSGTAYGLPPKAAASGKATKRTGRKGDVSPAASQPLSERADKPRSVWLEPRTLLLGVIVVGATMSEGAALNWLNLAVVDSFATPEEVGALAYATFVISMLVVRMLGARLLQRFGRLPVLYVSAAVALVGVLLFTMTPVLALVWVGIMLWGAGAAMTWPTIIGASADKADGRAPQRVAVVSAFSSVASLAFPPLLGLLGDSWGIRNALMLIPVALIVALFSIRASRPIADDVAAAGAELSDAEVMREGADDLTNELVRAA